MTVRVYDLRGRLLDARSLGELAAGEERFWDWRPVRRGGEPLPSGVCWLVFAGPDGRRTLRALVLH